MANIFEFEFEGKPTPRIEKVIIDQEAEGTGTQGDPYKTVICVYTLDGFLIATRTDADRKINNK